MADNKAEILITGDASQLAAAVGQAKGQLRELETSATGVSRAMEFLSRPIGAATAVLAVAGGLAALTKGAIASVAALDDLSEKTSLSVELLDKLSQVATIGGHDLDSMAGAAGKLAKSFSEALGGDKAVASLFRELGVEIRDAGGKARSFDDVLVETTGAIAKAENQTVALAYAQKLLGKGAAENLPMFKDLAEAGTLTARVSTEQAAAAEKAEKAWNRFKLRGEELKITLVNSVVPALTSVLEKIQEINRPGGLAGQKVDLPWLDGWMDTVVQKINAGSIRIDEALRSVYEKFGYTAGVERQNARISASMGNLQRAQDRQGGRALPDDTFAGGGGNFPRVQDRGRTLNAGLLNTGGSGDEAAKEAERLRQLDLKGWVAYAEAILDEAEATDKALAQIADDRNKREDQLQQESIKGWVAYADAVFEEAERADRAAADVLDELAKNEETAFRELMRQLGRETEKATDYAKEFGLVMTSSLEDLITKGGDARAVINALIADLAKMVVRATVTKPLANMVGQGINALGNWAIGAFGSTPGVTQNGWTSAEGGTGYSSTLLGTTARASGGYVEAGRMYRVNEMGTEYFQPGVSGKVIPMGQGDSGGVTIQQNISVGVAQTVRAEMLRLMPQMQRSMQAAWAARRGLGGSYAAA